MCICSFATASAPALAAGNHATWATEAHALGDNVRIVIAPSGHAEIDHDLHWQVATGALHSFDLPGVEESAVIHPEIAVTADDGTTWTAHAAWFAPRVLRVTADDPHGLHKGTYRFDLRYDVDLAAARELVRDGAIWRLAWSAPNALEGYDAAKVTVDLPAAPTAPRADMGGDNGDDGIVATVARSAARDTLDLERPHVGRGESVVWAVRLDPRALPDLAATHAQTRSAQGWTGANGAELPVVTRWRRALFGLGLCALGLLYGFAVKRRPGRALLTVAGSPRSRAALAGLSLAGGLALQISGRTVAGALFLAIAMVAATVRAAKANGASSGAARGPGSWSEVLPAAAFARSETRTWASRLGPFVRAGAVIFLVALAALAAHFAPTEYAVAALDALALVPLFVGAGVEASAVERSRPRLARAYRFLSSKKAMAAHRGELHVAPWGRRPVGRDSFDELRLRVTPRAAMPGAGAVELGFAEDASGAVTPEVLVRVQATSCASARIASLAPWAASVPGRTPDERVVRLSPRWPSARLAERLAERMALALVDRRDDGTGEFAGTDRRSARSTAPKSASDASILLLR